MTTLTMHILSRDLKGSQLPTHSGVHSSYSQSSIMPDQGVPVVTYYAFVYSLNRHVGSSYNKYTSLCVCVCVCV